MNVALDLNNGLLATGLSFWRPFYYDTKSTVAANIDQFLQATGLTVSEAHNTGTDQLLPLDQLSFFFQGMDLGLIENEAMQGSI